MALQISQCWVRICVLTICSQLCGINDDWCEADSIIVIYNSLEGSVLFQTILNFIYLLFFSKCSVLFFFLY